MKKTIFAALLAFVAFSAKAETGDDDKNLFNHLGIGVEVGTTGIGFDLATPIGNYVQMRAGMSFIPNIKVKDIDVDINGVEKSWESFQNMISAPGAPAEAQKYVGVDLPDNLLIDGKISMTDFKLLFDLYLSKKSSFHFTAGFYAGKSQIVEAYTTNCVENLEAITYYNKNYAGQYDGMDKIGVEIGDYLLEPNGGVARAYLKTSGFKPYLGIGSGRAVPRKRISFAWDLGVQFWGSPKIYMEQPNGQVQLQDEGLDGDGGDIIKTISKITVYPCLSLRINGRIF